MTLMKVLQNIKPVDQEKERSERVRSLDEFLVSYNSHIPDSFPRVTASILKVFQKAHPSLFADNSNEWSLERHRKRVMDWLPQHLKD